jgi:mRNA interferase RelE/StbE
LAYNILYGDRIPRDLSRLGKAEVRRVLDRIEKDLAVKADSCPMLAGKWAGLHKYRIGDYRVVFAIVKNDIRFVRIGHRRDVYR